MKVLICEPFKPPRAADIENTLEGMQTIVDGYIEVVHPWNEPIVVVCNEEGLLKKLSFNRCLNGHPIFGTFFLCSTAHEDFTDLPNEAMLRFASELYWPQRLVNIDGCLTVIQMEEPHAFR